MPKCLAHKKRPRRVLVSGWLLHRLKSIVGKLSLCSLDVFGVSLALKEHCVTARVFLSVFQNPIRITCSHCSVCSISDIVGISVEYKFFLSFFHTLNIEIFPQRKKMFSGNFFGCAEEVHPAGVPPKMEVRRVRIPSGGTPSG